MHDYSSAFLAGRSGFVADMTLSSSLFLLPLLFTIASCHLLPADRTTRELIARGGIEERIGRTRLQDRKPRSVSTLKVLDFSADIDQLPDSNGEYTGATLEAGPLPESFTICSALMVEAWTTGHQEAGQPQYDVWTLT